MHEVLSGPVALPEYQSVPRSPLFVKLAGRKVSISFSVILFFGDRVRSRQTSDGGADDFEASPDWPGEAGGAKIYGNFFGSAYV
jgi:hypothetical protein